MKCSFLDYIELLMIGWAIWVTKVNQNVEKTPKSSKNEMLIFGLCSTYGDQPSDESELKCKKGPLRHQKMKCLFLDYLQLLMIIQVIWVAKVDQNAIKGPLSHQKMKCLFLDHIQLLMIGWVVWATKVDQNAKKKRPPK